MRAPCRTEFAADNLETRAAATDGLGKADLREVAIWRASGSRRARDLTIVRDNIELGSGEAQVRFSGRDLGACPENQASL